MNEVEKGELSNGSSSEVTDFHRLVFFSLFENNSNPTVPRNGGVACALNDWKLKGGGM